MTVILHIAFAVPDQKVKGIPSLGPPRFWTRQFPLGMQAPHWDVLNIHLEIATQTHHFSSANILLPAQFTYNNMHLQCEGYNIPLSSS
jgi:hypothetical protein